MWLDTGFNAGVAKNNANEAQLHGRERA